LTQNALSTVIKQIISFRSSGNYFII